MKILSVVVEKETTEYVIYKMEKAPTLLKKLFGAKNYFERYKRVKGEVYAHYNYINAYYGENGQIMNAFDEEVKYIENWRRRF